MEDLSSQLNFDLGKTAAISCKSCGNYTFQAGVFLRSVSALISPSGKEGILPVPCFLCNACGQPAGETVHPALRVKDETPKPSTPTLSKGGLHLMGEE